MSNHAELRRKQHQLWQEYSGVKAIPHIQRAMRRDEWKRQRRTITPRTEVIAAYMTLVPPRPEPYRRRRWLWLLLFLVVALWLLLWTVIAKWQR